MWRGAWWWSIYGARACPSSPHGRPSPATLAAAAGSRRTAPPQRCNQSVTWKIQTNSPFISYKLYLAKRNLILIISFTKKSELWIRIQSGSRGLTTKNWWKKMQQKIFYISFLDQKLQFTYSCVKYDVKKAHWSFQGLWAIINVVLLYFKSMS